MAKAITDLTSSKQTPLVREDLLLAVAPYKANQRFEFVPCSQTEEDNLGTGVQCNPPFVNAEGHQAMFYWFDQLLTSSEELKVPNAIDSFVSFMTEGKLKTYGIDDLEELFY